ncbi:MAG: repeat domain protein [Proteobacteria bacterium]|nr:repeat domain protein [Pseudomonadota bacterium]
MGFEDQVGSLFPCQTISTMSLPRFMDNSDLPVLGQIRRRRRSGVPCCGMAPTVRKGRTSLLTLAIGLSMLTTAATGAHAAEDAAGPRYPDVEGLEDVLGQDLYADADKIHALILGKFIDRPHALLAYLSSADGGMHWSQPVFVTPEADPKVASRRGNDAQLAAYGSRLVAAWQERGELPGTGPMRLAYSEDSGRTWKKAAPPDFDDPTGTQSYLDVAADGKGDFHLVWLDDREENGNSQGLRHAISHDGGRRWTHQETIDDAVCTCCWNRLTALPDHSLAVLYRGNDPHDMQLATRADRGPWHHPGPVGRFDWHFSGCPHCGGGIAVTTEGDKPVLHGVVWTGVERAPGLYYLNSRTRGETWSPTVQVGASESREADIAVLSPARIAIVFGTTETGESRVQMRLSTDGGRTWSPHRPLSSPQTAADHPRILSTPFGFRAFWTERRPDGKRAWAMQSL